MTPSEEEALQVVTPGFSKFRANFYLRSTFFHNHDIFYLAAMIFIDDGRFLLFNGGGYNIGRYAVDRQATTLARLDELLIKLLNIRVYPALFSLRSFW